MREEANQHLLTVMMIIVLATILGLGWMHRNHQKQSEKATLSISQQIEAIEAEKDRIAAVKKAASRSLKRAQMDKILKASGELNQTREEKVEANSIELNDEENEALDIQIIEENDNLASLVPNVPTSINYIPYRLSGQAHYMDSLRTRGQAPYGTLRPELFGPTDFISIIVNQGEVHTLGGTHLKIKDLADEI